MRFSVIVPRFAAFVKLLQLLSIPFIFASVAYAQAGDAEKLLSPGAKLIAAASRGDISAVESALALGADLHFVEKATDRPPATALTAAVESGALEVVRMLFGCCLRKVPIPTRSTAVRSRTPIFLATSKRSVC
jgi:hypothetical protein